MDANVATLSLVQSSHSESSLIPVSALTVGHELKEYVITGIIGEGGFGIVYSALDTLLQRNVAIKEYMPASIANRTATSNINLISKRHQQTFAAGMQGFIDEARFLAQFKHPALVEILRFWEANDTAYMVMPHYSGKTLRNILKRDRNVSTEAWLKKTLEPILDAINLLHENNIYHRDIAPDNIVIQENGQPVLLDLGSARRVIAGMQNALTVVVKPGYAPIEQYTEDTSSEQGPWTDIYALGAVLYFALTGVAPVASVSRIMRDTLKPLSKNEYSSYSADFLGAINRALHLRPNDRFQNIAEFRDALNFNTAFSESITLLPPLKNSATPLMYTGEEDEITQILSEAEVNLFKEKLLNTLSDSTREPHRPIVDNELNENILVAPDKRSGESLNTFDDVKNLLDGKPIVSEKPKPSQQKSSDLNIQKPTSITTSKGGNAIQISHYLPFTLGALAIASIALTSIWLINSPNNKDIGADIFTAESLTTPTNTGKQKLYVQQNLTEKPTAIIQPNLYTIQKNTSHSTTSNPSDEFQRGLSGAETKLATDDFNTTANPEPMQIDKKSNAIGDSNDTRKMETMASGANAKADIRESTIVDSGVARITVIPWGEIWIDNQRYGVSPPVRELSLVAGSYHMELRNPGQPTEIRTIKIKPGNNPAIYHNFSAVQKEKIDNKAASNADKTAHKNNKIQSDTTNNEVTKDLPKQDMQNSEKTNAVSPQQKVAITTERTLHIKILPWGEIFVDGKIVGITPPLHQIKLSPGEHIIEIRHPKYTTKIVHVGPTDSLMYKLEHHFK